MTSVPRLHDGHTAKWNIFVKLKIKVQNLRYKNYFINNCYFSNFFLLFFSFFSFSFHGCNCFCFCQFIQSLRPKSRNDEQRQLELARELSKRQLGRYSTVRLFLSRGSLHARLFLCSLFGFTLTLILRGRGEGGTRMYPSDSTGINSLSSIRC